MACMPTLFKTLLAVLTSPAVAQNANEGHPGNTTSEIGVYAAKSLPGRPNVVLLHTGTNYMKRPDDPANAPSRLSAVIDQIFKACPDATLLLARIIPSGNSVTNSRIDIYNDNIESPVMTRQNKCQHIMLVDMNKITSTSTDMFDDLHPNDQGYRKMAMASSRGFRLSIALAGLVTRSTWTAQTIKQNASKSLTGSKPIRSKLLMVPVWGKIYSPGSNVMTSTLALISYKLKIFY